MSERKPPKLAPGVFWKHGAFYRIRQNKWIRLGETEAEAYAALGELASERDTMAALFKRYRLEVLPKKALATQRQYKAALTTLEALIGHMEPRTVKPVTVAEIHDELGKTAPVNANRTVAVLSAVMKLGLRTGAIEANPCRGLGRHTEAPRTRYVTDSDKAALEALAPAWLRTFMEFAALTGQRSGNLIRLQVSDCREDGIHFPSDKRGKPVIVEWSEALSMAHSAALAQRQAFTAKSRVVPLALLLNARGQKLTASGLRSAWRRLWATYAEKCAETEEVPIEHFTIHDLRAKAGSESHDDRLLGHQNPAVLHRVYKRRPEKVKPVK